MAFPEWFVGESVSIDQDCAICFSPHSRCYAVVACNTSPRRVKLRLDFSQSSRYCTFFRAVGAVGFGDMSAEVTMAPFRARSVGLLEPSDGPAGSTPVLFSRLRYTAAVFAEDKLGVMRPKRRLPLRENGAAKRERAELLPATPPARWPVWLTRRRPRDFIATNEATNRSAIKLAIAGKREDGGLEMVAVEKRTDGDETKGFVTQRVEPVAGGLAFLVSVVNTLEVPILATYKLSQTQNSKGDGEHRAPDTQLVPVDGLLSDDGGLSSFVPSNGDAALGWVLRGPHVQCAPPAEFIAATCDPQKAERAMATDGSSLLGSRLAHSLAAEEALARIAVESTEKARRVQMCRVWVAPPCVICGAPVEAAGLMVEDPTSGGRAHFACYHALRQESEAEMTREAKEWESQEGDSATDMTG